jgi:hypothetical protein
MYDELASIEVTGFEKTAGSLLDKYSGYLLVIRGVSIGPETYRQTQLLPL